MGTNQDYYVAEYDGVAHNVNLLSAEYHRNDISRMGPGPDTHKRNIETGEIDDHISDS